jgi:hypothetical protein
MTFTTSAAVDSAYDQTLVTAALNGTLLPHFRVAIEIMRSVARVQRPPGSFFPGLSFSGGHC